MEQEQFTVTLCDSIEDKYRFGFNGMEKDNELKGIGNSLDFGARIYDSRLGRWLSVDPLAANYSFASPYNFALNTPIQAMDPNGELVVYVNGLRFNESIKRFFVRSFTGFSKPKLGDDPNFTNQEGIYNNYEDINSKATSTTGYWSDDAKGTVVSLKNEFNEKFKDDNNVYADGTNRWGSSKIRYREGRKAAQTLIDQINSGDVVLKPGETIKIVGHSQGAMYAAGMAQELVDNGYAVEQVVYLAPHQPRKFKHPEGVIGSQYSRKKIEYHLVELFLSLYLGQGLAKYEALIVRVLMYSLM